METFCPECMGSLATTDGKTARCTVHGGVYQILFLRAQSVQAHAAMAPAALPVATLQPSAPAGMATPIVATRGVASPVSAGMCLRHATVLANYACARCGVPMCSTCAFPQPDGRMVCPTCATGSVQGVFIGTTTGPAVPVGVMCSRHPMVQAVQQCQVCRKPVCATCDFALPGNVHVCPDCATKTEQGLSSKRKVLVGWSYALAVWSTLGLAVLLSGALAELAAGPGGEQVLGVVLSIFLYVPSLVGTALGFSSFDRRLSNPAVIWVAVIWNVLILACLLLLTVLGLFMG